MESYLLRFVNRWKKLMWYWAVRPGLAACAFLLVSAALLFAGETATVSFSLDFPASDPAHYSIAVNSDGHAKYECLVRTSPDSDERETYQAEFAVTPSTRSRIFDLASEAKYFSSGVDSGNRKLAFTGSKKLAYQNGTATHTAEYNYSNLPSVQKLTEIFQSLASTLEYGRRLAYYHRYQKLALDDELKRMEAQAKNNELTELQAVQPVLQQLYEDTSVMNVVRARAERLIEIGKNSAGTSR
jgi:hypothetical protein